MPRGQNASCTDLVTLTIQHWRRLSLPPLENAVPRARNRLSLIITSLLRTVASHRFHPRYWQCKLLITLSRPRIAIVASGSRALHACMQRDGHGAYITNDARIRSGPTKARKALVQRIIQRFNSPPIPPRVESIARQSKPTEKGNFIRDNKR